jgi:hypothetical protein
MKSALRPIAAVREGLYLARKAYMLLLATLCFALSVGTLWLLTAPLLAGTTALAGGVALVIGLAYNQTGVYQHGIAPVFKPLKAFAQAPYVIPWEAIQRIEISGPNAEDFVVEIRHSSGALYLHRYLIRRQFRNRKALEDFHRAMLAAERLSRKGDLTKKNFVRDMGVDPQTS